MNAYVAATDDDSAATGQQVCAAWDLRLQVGFLALERGRGQLDPWATHRGPTPDEFGTASPSGIKDSGRSLLMATKMADADGVETPRLTTAESRYFRDDLRASRAKVLADAEAYARPIHSIERLGRFLRPEARALGRMADALNALAGRSPLAQRVHEECPSFHRSFASLFENLRDARNDAMHTGARARHLTTLAVDACLVLEDALGSMLDRVSDFMVREPVVVEWWHPISLARQKLLENSFTFLPVIPSEGRELGALIADHELARFLGPVGSDRRAKRLARSVGSAIEAGDLATVATRLLRPDERIEDVIDGLGAQPFLVVESGRLLGILTAFDVL